MTETNAANGANMRQLIDADLQDTLDEEIEMELDDIRLQTARRREPTCPTPKQAWTASFTSTSCCGCKASW